jgi:antitoxin CcdA
MLMQKSVKPRKRSVNLSIDAELLDEAKVGGCNLSALLEKALREELRTHRRETWLERNRAAIEADKAQLERDGPWYTPDWLAE